MRRSTTIARFPRGIVTDEMRGDALVQADDVIPLPNKAGYRTRGGKVVLTSNASMNGNSYAFPLPTSATQTGLFVIRRTTGGVYTPCWWDGTAAAYNAMEGQAFNAAGTALTFTGRTNQFFIRENKAARFDGQLWGASALNGESIGVRWAGKAPGMAGVPASAYVTGTVATTAGSTTITGTGTTWTGNVVEGQYIWINNAGLTDRAYRIVGLNSNTSLTVDRPLPVSTTTQTYRVVHLTYWSVKAGTFGANIAPNGSITPVNSGSTMIALAVCTHAGRMFVANTKEYVVNGAYNVTVCDRMRWSATANETEATLLPGTGAAQWGGAEYFHPNGYLDVDAGDGAASGSSSAILAMASFGGSLFIFKSGAVYILRGDVETDGRDIGASIDPIMRNDGLYGGMDPVVTPFGVIFTGRKGVYLLTPGGVTDLTARDKVRGLYQSVITNVLGGYGSGGGSGMLSWTGRRLIIQNGKTRAQSVGLGQSAPNTIVWYPDLDVWVTQSTFACGIVYADAVASPLAYPMFPNEVAVSQDGTTGLGQMMFWGPDEDFYPIYVQAGRAEAPLMKMTSHPVPLEGGMNGRLRTILAKAKVVDTSASAPSLVARVLLGEQIYVEGANVLLGAQGYDTGVEASIAAANSFGATAAQTEKWRRMSIRVGTPPVDMVRFQFQQVGSSLDVRVYQAGVEHVSVSRQR